MFLPLISSVKLSNVEPVTHIGVPLPIFVIFAILLVSTALGVILSRQLIHSVLFLVTNLLGVAVFYAFLGSPFLASVQVTLYAGAVVVLFLFIVMLLNIKFDDFLNKSAVFYYSLFAIVFLLAYLILVNLTFSDPNSPKVLARFTPTTREIGEKLFTIYALPFEISSLVLLVAMVAAVMLTKKKNKKHNITLKKTS
jgi:NADH-quinone oxidoreductase subunit J